MHKSIAVFTVRDVTASLRDFEVADLDGNMLFFGMESKKTTG
jgi:hypothetical protein